MVGKQFRVGFVMLLFCISTTVAAQELGPFVYLAAKAYSETKKVVQRALTPPSYYLLEGQEKKADTQESLKKQQPKINPEALTKAFAGKIPQEVTEILEFLRNPERFARVGAQMPKGILLFGPPGTGKTTIARGIAEAGGSKFIAVNGSDFNERYAGVGSERVRALFENARWMVKSGEATSAIIFIDEIDAVGGKRTGEENAVARDNQQTLLQLLAQMDGFYPSESVVVIGATNRPDKLDAALLRPGRFDRKVLVDLPTLENRCAILKHHAARCPLDATVDFDFLAAKTEGFSAAELKNLVNEAAIRAARRDGDMVSLADFELALQQTFALN